MPDVSSPLSSAASTDGRRFDPGDLDAPAGDSPASRQSGRAQPAGRGEPTQQVANFKPRLDQAIGTIPTGYKAAISAYLTSEKAAALALDQSVNRPADVASTAGKALDAFYAQNPKADRDPARWTPQQRAGYEPQILSAYAFAHNSDRKMTDAEPRGEAIMASPLSGASGSLVRSVT